MHRPIVQMIKRLKESEDSDSNTGGSQEAGDGGGVALFIHFSYRSCGAVE